MLSGLPLTTAFLFRTLPLDGICILQIVINWLCHDTISARMVIGPVTGPTAWKSWSGELHDQYRQF